MPRQESKTLSDVEAELDVKPEDKRTAKKEFEIERLPEGLYSIRFSAGGEVPDVLKGRFTSSIRAEAMIANYKLERTVPQE